MAKKGSWNRLSSDETEILLRMYFNGTANACRERAASREYARFLFEHLMESSLGFVDQEWWLDTYRTAGYVSCWKRPATPLNQPEPDMKIAVDEWLESGWRLLMPEFQEQLTLF